MYKCIMPYKMFVSAQFVWSHMHCVNPLAELDHLGQFDQRTNSEHLVRFRNNNVPPIPSHTGIIEGRCQRIAAATTTAQIHNV